MIFEQFLMSVLCFTDCVCVVPKSLEERGNYGSLTSQCSKFQLKGENVQRMTRKQTVDQRYQVYQIEF